MTKHIKEYILLAGYRRFNAVKKLGWNKISAKVYNTDEMVELPLGDIDMGENSRKEESSVELTELMQSIKQNGLIQPIVVAVAKDLTESDFIALNLTENVQRKDLSPFEVSLRIKRLKQLGLNNGEIAVRLGMNKERVRHLSELGNTFNDKQMERVSFVEHGKDMKGKVSYTTAKVIANSRLNKTNKQKLLSAVGKDEMTMEKTDIVIRLINAGMTTKQAVKQAKFYCRLHPNVIVKIKDIDELKAKYGIKSRAGIILGILKGKVKANPDIFYQSRDLSDVADEE